MSRTKKTPLTKEELTQLATEWEISLIEWVEVLHQYTTEARLKCMLPLLAQRLGGRARVISHRELSLLLGASREKTTAAVNRCRKENPEWFSQFGQLFRLNREDAAAVS